MIDVHPDLKRRIDELAAALSVLSEASAGKLERDHAGKPQSKAPPGAHEDTPTGARPDPDDRLLEYFIWRLEHARTEVAVVAAVAEVEIRAERRRNARVARIADMSGRDTQTERDRRIAEDYPGLEPGEVAAVESEAYGFCRPANVRKVRLDRHRDPETGVPQPGGSPREQARRLRGEGWSIRSIAVRLGRPKSTVQGWLSDGNGEAAA